MQGSDLGKQPLMGRVLTCSGGMAEPNSFQIPAIRTIIDLRRRRGKMLLRDYAEGYNQGAREQKDDEHRFPKETV